LWYRLAAVAPIGLLAWESPYAVGVTLTKKRRRMDIIQKCTNYKFWRGCGEKGTLLHCVGNVN